MQTQVDLTKEDRAIMTTRVHWKGQMNCTAYTNADRADASIMSRAQADRTLISFGDSVRHPDYGVILRG